MLEKENGQILGSHDEIEGEILEFYGNLMGTREQELECVDIVALRRGNQLHMRQRLDLERHVSEKEV